MMDHATGRVFIRFAESVDAASRGADIAGAGFRIVQTLPWAPHAAWLEPQSGSAQLDALRGLADVEHVEPQVLMDRAKR